MKKRFTFVELMVTLTFVMVIALLIQAINLRKDISKNKRRAAEVERVEVPNANMAPIPPVVNPFAPVQTTTVTVEKWPDIINVSNMDFYTDRQGKCCWQYIKTITVKNVQNNEEKIYNWNIPEVCK